MEEMKKYSKIGVVEFDTGNNVDRLLGRIWIESTIDKESGCWLWNGSKVPDGYGKLRVNKRIQPIHRLAYLAYKGVIPKQLVVRHKCDVRNCWNPEHLEVGTVRDNILDCMKRGRHPSGLTEPTPKNITPSNRKRPPLCSNGHEYTTKNTHVDMFGHRNCRACANAKSRRLRAKSKSQQTQQKVI